ncbi:MAG: TetR family transcriptional regulator [Pseudomonadales bacterium]|nr:TetR/AcrR family transcriptional regulator [Pseudomonadales bacterium]NIX09160.1 TetR family transcriptional regulator [Pseudomonadales bacterium]
MNVKSTRVRRNPKAAREEILAAAMAALQDTRFSELTVESLMKRTGMTRSSFYHYFSGLDEIVLGMLEGFAADIRRTVDPWLKGELDEPDHRAATLRHLTAMFEVFELHARSVAAVAQAAGGSQEVYHQWQRGIVDYFIDLTADFIRRQRALGRSGAEDPDRLARALILMNNAAANDNMTREKPDGPAVIGAVLGGIWNSAIYGPGPMGGSRTPG